MRAKIEKWQLAVIEELCERVNRNDFKIGTAELSFIELYVLKKLEKSHSPYGGWWDEDDLTNIVVEYDPDHDSWDVYCGDGWI